MAKLALPLVVTEFGESFVVRDAAGKSVCAVYFDDGCTERRNSSGRMTKDEADVFVRWLVKAAETARG